MQPSMTSVHGKKSKLLCLKVDIVLQIQVNEQNINISHTPMHLGYTISSKDKSITVKSVTTSFDVILTYLGPTSIHFLRYYYNCLISGY